MTALGLGAAGIFLPLLPTTPFLLLAAACFLRSSDRLYSWLITHKRFGRTLRQYREHRAIPRQTKLTTLLLLWGTLAFSALVVLESTWGRLLLLAIGIGVSRHVLSMKTIKEDDAVEQFYRFQPAKRSGGNDMSEKITLLGALAAIAFYVIVILVFVSRLAGKPHYGYWIGLFQFLLVPTLIFLLWNGPRLGRPIIYYLQCGLMLAWLVLELYLDYIGKVDFRHTRWIVIAYVTLLFAGSGGMIGVASLAGRPWTVAAVILFLAMAVLAFVQRAITGM